MELSPRSVRFGQVVTVFAAKGGCGRTTLAVNLAVVLNQGGSRRVCLVDLDVAFGDVASTLRLESTKSLVDAVANTQALDRPMDHVTVRAALTPYAPGLDCVLAPLGPGASQHVTAGMVGEVLTELPRWYDYVVIDTPARFSSQVLAALDSSHHHVLLTTPERPALENLRLTLDTLDLLAYDRGSRSIVFNRCDSGVGLSAAEVEAVLKCSISAHIPSSRDVPTSINLGQPLASAMPEHPVSRAIRAFAEERLIAHHTGGAPTSG